VLFIQALHVPNNKSSGVYRIASTNSAPPREAGRGARPGGRASAEAPPRRITSSDNAFLAELEAVRGRLAERGAAPGVLAHVEDVLVAQHQRYHAWMAAEADKRRTLLGLVRSLEARPCSKRTACERGTACSARDWQRGAAAGHAWRPDAHASLKSAGRLRAACAEWAAAHGRPSLLVYFMVPSQGLH
jgi:hypothetical protein